jgi:hypothetical protein
LRFFIACLLILISVTPTWAQNIERVAFPDWFDIAEIPQSDPKLLPYSIGGVEYRLLDRQSRIDNPGRVSMSRSVVTITNRAGLEKAGRLEIEFDAEWEQLALVRLHVLRDGEVIDLTDKITFDIFQRETELDQGIQDGLQTAFANIADLRIGDMVDTTWKFIAQPKLPRIQQAGLYPVFDGVPIMFSRVIFDMPADAAFQLAPDSDVIAQHLVEETAGRVRHIYLRHGEIPPEPEEYTPIEYEDQGAAQFSFYTDWAELSAVFDAHYLPEHGVPEAWADRLDAIRADHPDDPVAQAFATLHLVQDEIRYVGIELGTGGLLARSPSQVVAQGYGDCKDKSLLLRELLRALGFEAEVAMAHTTHGHGTVRLLPRISAFNHMITGVKLGEDWYWMDPTLTFQGGIAPELTVEPDHGYVLPITAGRDELTLITPFADKPAYNTDVHETFEFGALGMWLTVKTVYERGRRLPLYVASGSDISHRIDVHNAPISFNPPPPLARFKHGVFYRLGTFSNPTEGLMTLEWQMATYEREVAAGEVGVLFDLMEEIKDNAYFSWNITPDERRAQSDDGEAAE